jgi:2'-hydroxyisoflavone reductase
VKLLVIGGTRFVGRAFVEQAVRHGHDVAVFHRSVSEPEDFPSVEHLHGDRDGQLGLLRGRSWDAVLDTCAYIPRAVREASVVLQDFAGHYTLVSTLSVHPDDMPAGSTERAATHRSPFPQAEMVTAETYGPLKVACEHEAKGAFGNRCLIIRPATLSGRMIQATGSPSTSGVRLAEGKWRLRAHQMHRCRSSTSAILRPSCWAG